MPYIHFTGKRPRVKSGISNLRDALNDLDIKNVIKQSESYRDMYKINFKSWNKAESILHELRKEGFDGFRSKTEIHIKKR